MRPVVLIPARMASSRLPGKPLADIAGKPMLWHVWSQARQADVARVVIATDSLQIQQVMQGLGAEVVLTADHHQSGSERLAEACQLLALDPSQPVVNVQGDEPLIDPGVIDQVAALLARSGAAMATLSEPIEEAGVLMNPNVVKVVADRQGRALTFSRSPIPWHRDLFGSRLQAHTPLPVGVPFRRHVGIYAYTAGFLHRYVRWPVCEMERVEALEQLRVLWQGESIALADAQVHTQPGVDTPEDLARVRAVFARRQPAA